MNNAKREILSFVFREFYLFWAAGLTLGVYIVRVKNYYNLYFTAGTSFILIMLVIEIIMIRKLSRYGMAAARNDLKFLILIVIPFLILLVIGNLITAARQYSQDRSILKSIHTEGNFFSNDVVIEGRVSSHPLFNFGDLIFLLDVESIRVRDSLGNIKDFSSVNESVNIRLDNAEAGSIKRDDYLRLNGKLNKQDLQELKNGKQYRLIFIAESEDTERIVCSGLAYQAFNFRKRLYHCIRSTFYRNLETYYASIAEALILGNRNNMSGQLQEYFKRCGAYHLFAISGLHISFFISMLILPFKKIRRTSIVLWTAIAMLVIYNFLVGGRASMIRASIMTVFILLALNWKREYNSRFLLYLSYMIMVLSSPYFIYDLGFWMSYGSMSALIFIYPVLIKITDKILPLLRRKINLLTRISLSTFSIYAVLFPVLAYFFNEVSLISPVSNVLILPPFYILLFILIISSLTCIIWPPAAAFILQLSTVFFKYILQIVKVLGKPDFLVLNFNDYQVKDVVIYYIIFLVILSAVNIIIKRTSDNKSSKD